MGDGNAPYGQDCPIGITPEAKDVRGLHDSGAEWLAKMRPRPHDNPLPGSGTFCQSPPIMPESDDPSYPLYYEPSDCGGEPSNIYKLLEYIYGPPPQFQLRD